MQPIGERAAALAAGLTEMGCQALLVVAQSASDPDLVPFLLAPVHVGAALLVAPRGTTPALAYLSAMEREEALAGGLPLLSPEKLEVLRAAAEAPRPEDQLAWVVGRAQAAAGVAPGRVALAGHAPAGELYGACAALARQGGWQWVAGNELVREVRKRKTAIELQTIRQAAAAAAAAMRAVAGCLAAAAPERPAPRGIPMKGARGAQGSKEAPGDKGAKAVKVGPDGRRAVAGGGGSPAGGGASAGASAGVGAAGEGAELWLGGERLTVGRLRAEAARVMAERGVEQPYGNIVAPGDEGGVPHSAGTDARTLHVGEALVVDLFPRAAGRGALPLYADCTRTLCAGPPPPLLLAAHAAVLGALAAARNLAVPGARGWDLQQEVCRRFAAAGYLTPLDHPGTLTGYVHNLGHGVGFELHELPIFRQVAGAEGVLAPGDVFTLEPGLYDAGAGYGVRVEDLFHLTPSGAELLTPLAYDLDPRAYAD